MMDEVTVRELRNHGGKALDRVEAGERLTVTRSGRPIAEMCPLPRRGFDAATLLERWKHVPRLDLAALRRDMDEVIVLSL